MRFNQLGRTGLRVSEISFGCGATAGALTTGSVEQAGTAAQERVVGAALDAGINYFDTSPVYPGSEEALGRVLGVLKAEPYVATKVMLTPEEITDRTVMASSVVASVDRSLRRLGVEELTVVQLHNRLGTYHKDRPEAAGGAIVTPDDVLGEGGILETLEGLRHAGKIRYLGFGSFGSVGAVHTLIDSGRFDMMLTLHNLLNPSAGLEVPFSFRYKDYQRIIGKAHAAGMGVVVLRCLAGGALTQAEAPHPMTARSKRYSTIDAAELAADRVRAQMFDFLVREDQSLAQAAVRFVVDTPGVTTALIGISVPEQIDELGGAAGVGELSPSDWDRLIELYRQPWFL